MEDRIEIVEKILFSAKFKDFCPENISNEKEALYDKINKTDKLINEYIIQNSLPISVEFKNTLEINEKLSTYISSMDTILQKNKDLEVDLKVMQNECTFIQTEIANNHNLKSYKKEIKDIFKISKILRKCIQFELFNEVFLIVAFCRNLNKYFNTDKIIISLMEDVKTVEIFFISDLVEKLMHDISLSHAIKIIGCLRHLLSCNEDEYKLLFLQSRAIYLNKELEKITENEAFNRVKMINKLIHENILNILSQYLAIFNDGKPICFINRNKNHFHLSNWIEYFLTKYINQIIEILEEELKKDEKLDYGELVNTFYQINYFSIALHRSYVYFNAKFNERFREFIISFFSSIIKKSTNLSTNQLFDENINQSLLSNNIFTFPNTLPSFHNLSKIPSLAIFYNTFISIHNYYANFFPLNIACDLSKLIQNSLESYIMAIAQSTNSNKLLKEIYLKAFIYNFLPNICHMMKNSIHNTDLYNLYTGRKRIDLIEYIQVIRKDYEDTPFPGTLNYPWVYHHFRTRNILIHVQKIMSTSDLNLIDRTLMFSFQFD